MSAERRRILLAAHETLTAFVAQAKASGKPIVSGSSDAAALDAEAVAQTKRGGRAVDDVDEISAARLALILRDKHLADMFQANPDLKVRVAVDSDGAVQFLLERRGGPPKAAKLKGG